MVFCEFCVLPGQPARDAVWQLVMGSEQCDQIMEFALCEDHKVLMVKAATLIEDSCDPPHRMDEIIIQQLGSEKPDYEVMHPDHPALTPATAVKIFEGQRKQFTCGDCGTVFGSMKDLVKHQKIAEFEQQRQVIADKLEMGGKKQ